MKVQDLIQVFKEEQARPRSDLRHVWAVFWANFKIFLSYRTWVITETLSTVASIAMYSFMGLQVPPDRLVEAGYGNVNWLAFALVGIASTNYLWMCIGRLSHSLQHEIRDGTFETVVSSPIRLRSYVIGMSIRGFLVSSYFMVGALLVGTLVCRAPLTINLETALSSIVLFLMLILSHLGIGIVAAGVILVYKKGDPVAFLFSAFTEFFGGVLFPLKLLANYPVLHAVAWAMPYTYALEALRRVLLTGATVASPEVFTNILILMGYTLVFMPLGLLAFRWGYNRVRTEGTTASY